MKGSQDLMNAQFSKAAFGYRQDEVDDYVRSVAATIRDLTEDNKDLEEKLEVMRRHIRLTVEYKGEYIGMRESRKIAAYYIKGIPGAAKFRGACGSLRTLSDLEELIGSLGR